jgi:SAM-dependent methyltransferase
MPQSQEVVTVFDAAVAVYRKMIAHNYLNHAEVYECLRQRLELMPPFRFLDVACWNGQCSADVLRGTNIAAYHGIDIVPSAIDEARASLPSKLACPINLVTADYVSALADWAEPVDVAWIGLSLHHQQKPGKLAVMRDLHRVLSDYGILLIYENTSPDGEDRDAWMMRWDRQREAWKEYSAEEWNTMRAHVGTYDFPETLSAWRQLGEAAGFKSVSEIYSCPTDLFRMFEFRKG